MKTSVESLEGNKVRLSIELEEQEFEQDLDAAFRRIAREVRIPGFRPGKAPRRILEARIGVEAARQEALREALPTYYTRAVTESDVDVIAPPEIDITAGEDSGPIAFDAVVEVRPRVVVPGYGSLRVTVPSPSVADEDVDAQIERLRGQFGQLESVDRPARNRDFVTIDIAGSVDDEPVEGLTADDYSYQVGSEAVVPELDARLLGAKVGDILVFDADHPDPESDDDIHLRVLVKDVQEQVLPEVDDEWANEASEFETVDELRHDLRQRLATMKRAQSQMSLSQGVMDALVELVEEDAPEPLVAEEVQRRARDLSVRLSNQGASIEAYLQATGGDPAGLAAELRAQAVAGVKADLALRAVSEAEQLEVSDAELDAEIVRIAAQLGEKPAAFRRRIERADQVQAVRSDRKQAKALEWLIERAEVVDEEGRTVDRAELDMPVTDGPSPHDTAEQDSPPTEEQA